MMKISILTLFPEMFDSPLKYSLIGKAIERGIIQIDIINLRDYALDKHRQVDDYPYGGGAGMVIKADVALRALRELRRLDPETRTILMSPAGRPLNQQMARDLAREKKLLVLCGHYEGVDERVLTEIDDQVSIGDYILMGGETAALVLIEVVVRLVPGVLGSEISIDDESFSDGLLEYPQYTRPRKVGELEVPPVLLSGNHEEIRRWRKKESVRKTLLMRPDLLLKKRLDEEEKKYLMEILFPGEDGEQP
ncbi:MAG: tRNA (guanosine(37)-N1)-methyltransferase TrmD [Syntrophomonadaceae bacterium]|nr:tRNA (guanosine(37)-N1)-methyltransferase TrmD [Syntrophomonadaceae bacterium]